MERLITLVDGEQRRSAIIGGFGLPALLSYPRLIGDRWRLLRYMRVPELDLPGHPPAYLMVS